MEDIGLLAIYIYLGSTFVDKKLHIYKGYFLVHFEVTDLHRKSAICRYRLYAGNSETEVFRFNRYSKKCGDLCVLPCLFVCRKHIYVKR